MLNVIVTGAAGLIGGEVCALLCAAGYRVTALVHRNRVVRGNDRSEVPVMATIPVDVDLPRFGLDDESWTQLMLGNELLIHCAAVTRFDLPWMQHRATNIGGTAHAIELAREGGLGLIHVSTAYVCGLRDGTILETDPLPGGGFANAYEASKAAAERLVMASGVPFVIARPSIVVGNSRTGAIREFETSYAVFKAMAEGRIRTIPFQRDATLDFVPIDHVARSIAMLSRCFREVEGQAFHLVSGDPVGVGEFVAAIGAFPQFNRPELVPAEQFDPAELPLPERRRYMRLARHYASYFQRDPRFDDRALRAATGQARPRVGPGRLRLLIRYCIVRGFLADGEFSECRGNAAPAVCGRPMPT